MGAMLLARSATASTGRRKATSQSQPEPLIPSLVPDQPAPSAAADRVHKAIYRRQQAAELSQPGCLTGARAARPADAGGADAAGHCHERRRTCDAATPRQYPAASQAARRHAASRSPWRGPMRCARTRPAHSRACRNEGVAHARGYAQACITFHVRPARLRRDGNCCATFSCRRIEPDRCSYVCQGLFWFRFSGREAR
jgi:hypothetical protein